MVTKADFNIIDSTIAPGAAFFMYQGLELIGITVVGKFNDKIAEESDPNRMQDVPLYQYISSQLL